MKESIAEKLYKELSKVKKRKVINSLYYNYVMVLISLQHADLLIFNNFLISSS